jgi:hypothetical protein
MSTSSSLYNAIANDDLDLLTPGSISDYGFFAINENDWHDLFGAYQSIAKFKTKANFISIMHNAYIDQTLHETVDKLTKEIPVEFRNHWTNFISKNNKIKPFYL